MNRLITNRLFDEFFTNWDTAFFNGDHTYWRRENNNIITKDYDSHYECRVPLPGYKKENIKVTIKDGTVSLIAKQDDDTQSYSLALPDDVDASKLSAHHEDGLLTIKLKKEKEAQPIEIEIK
jgi:HSP20 family molecular chaperone IbpA